MKAPRLLLLAAAAAAAVMLAPRPAHAQFAVAGSVVDSANVAVPGIRVQVWDDDPGPDLLLTTVWTDAMGTFVAQVPPIDFGEPNPDIYVRIEWIFQMDPPATFGNHTYQLVQHGPKAGPFNSFDAVNRCQRMDQPTDSSIACGTLTLNDALNSARASVANLTKLLNQSLNYYVSRKGAVTWTVDYDVAINIITDDPTSFVQGSSVNIADVDINAVTINPSYKGYQSDIYHEMAHLVHKQIMGGSFPSDGVADRNHQLHSEKSSRFAFVEGWAEYVQDRTSTETGHANDNKVAGIRDSNRLFWRGGSNVDVDGPAESTSGRTGREGMSYENGEEVEGALAGFLHDVHHDATLGAAQQNFPIVFGALIAETPDDAFELIRRMAGTAMAGSDATKRYFSLAQKRGLFWSRAAFDAVAFDEDPPADDADGATPGNRVVDDNFEFVRGVVKTNADMLALAFLGAAHRFDGAKVRIGYKPAADDTADEPTLFTNFTPKVNVTNHSALIEMDTRTFGGDGNWDLILAAENVHGFDDEFFPTWKNDPTTAVNTNEKYLKSVGTWYDRDRDPATETIKQGMVIVDNTAPTVPAASFKPQ